MRSRAQNKSVWECKISPITEVSRKQSHCSSRELFLLKPGEGLVNYLRIIGKTSSSQTPSFDLFHILAIDKSENKIQLHKAEKSMAKRCNQYWNRSIGNWHVLFPSLGERLACSHWARELFFVFVTLRFSEHSTDYVMIDSLFFALFCKTQCTINQ